MIILQLRLVLSRWILKEAISNKSEILLENAKSSDEFGVTLAFDDWKNVAHQYLLSTVLITSLGDVVI